jgi:hypothetical protein
MKRLLLGAIVSTSFIGVGASANDVYGGFAEGNPDLSDQHQPTEAMAAVQPSVGDRFDRYQGFADDNPDLFKADRSGPIHTGSDPQFYGGFGGNPDLRY